MDVTEIMEALDTDQPVYQREAVQAAMDQGDEVVLPLVGVLERVLQDPEKYSDEEYESFLPFYALYLLGHHQAREAHPVLIELMSLPGEMTYDLFGDALTEGFPVTLWKTSGGDPSDIMRLVKDRRADEYCRAAAVRALTYGVVDGSLTREEVIAFLQGLIAEDAASEDAASEDAASEDATSRDEASEDATSRDEASEDAASRDAPMVYNSAALQLSRLWPGESMELLKKAMDDGLIERGYIDMTSFNMDLSDGKEARLAAFMRTGQKELARTPHEELQSWPFFNSGKTRGNWLDTSHPDRPSTHPDRPSTGERRAATKNQKKRQRRQARAARKKKRSRKKR